MLGIRAISEGNAISALPTKAISYPVFLAQQLLMLLGIS